MQEFAKIHQQVALKSDQQMEHVASVNKVSSNQDTVVSKTNTKMIDAMYLLIIQNAVSAKEDTMMSKENAY